MSNKYWARVGYGNQWVKGSGIQMLNYDETLEKVGKFSLYADHGRLTDWVQMGMFVEVYNDSTKIFKGRILSYDEDDSGFSMGGSNLSVHWPNVYVDMQDAVSGNLRDLIGDLMDENSAKKMVDNVDAITYVRPTNLARKWLIHDKPLSTTLSDLVPSSQDPSGFRKNTFYLDAYDRLHVEPIGSAGEFNGYIDVKKSKIGAITDGNFCNYAVIKGHRAVPFPANKDDWTQNNADDYSGPATDTSICKQGTKAIREVSSGSTIILNLLWNTVSPKDFSNADYIEAWVRAVWATGTLNLSSSSFYLSDTVLATAAQAYWDTNIQGITSMTSGNWYKIRCPLDFTPAGDQTDIKEVAVAWVFSTSESKDVIVDGMFVDVSQRTGTVMNEQSIKTFGLFEKRKSMSQLKLQADVDSAAAGLLSPYPKMKYNISAIGFVPINLNQTIKVRWKGVDWVLPLTQRKINFNGADTSTSLVFGGIPLSADDVAISLAADLRSESYGKRIRPNKAVNPGDDPETQNTIIPEEGDPAFSDSLEFIDLLTPLIDYKGRAGSLLAPNAERYRWENYSE